jgi:predicted acylesterase/phospholipase RssA
MKKYNTLILSGGGIKGFGMLGTLQSLYHNNKLNGIKKIIGTSIGSVIGYLLILGIQPTDIVIQCIQKNYFQKLKKFNLVNGIRGKGFLEFDIFETMLRDFSSSKLKTDTLPTFKELYEYNDIDFKVITFNYTKNREEILSKETTPDLSILEGTRMSSNIPFIFSHYNYKDSYYFDGFITSNFALHLIDMKEDITLGICSIRNQWKEDKENKSWKIIWNLFILPFFNIETIRNKPYIEYVDIINLSFDELSFLDFHISNKQMLDMYSIGYTQSKSFLEENK